MPEYPFEDKRIILASYAHLMHGEFTKLGGPALALKDFLKTRVARLTCIWQPLPISDVLDGVAEIYTRDSRSQHRFPFPNWPWSKEGDVTLLYLVLKLRDVLATLWFGLRFRDSAADFIGVEALNALIGVMLRKARFVNRVIYWNLDYGEVRFKNALLNRTFHTLDRLAARHSDCIWNLSPAMANAREKKLGTALRAPQITVPIGTDFERIERLPVEQVERNSIVYLGVLADKCGVPLILDSFPEVVRRVPAARLVIIGGGPLEAELRAKAAATGLGDRIEFTGRVSDEAVEARLCRCGVGIAPYLADPNSTKRFTDVTKPRMYMTCGLPVIITDVPPVAKEIAANQAGIVIRYDETELTDAVVRLLTDETLFLQARQNAIALASRYSWVQVFCRAFSDTQAVLHTPHQQSPARDDVTP